MFDLRTNSQLDLLLATLRDSSVSLNTFKRRLKTYLFAAWWTPFGVVRCFCDYIAVIQDSWLSYLLTKAERNNAIVDITLRPGPVLLVQFEYTLRCQIHAALCWVAFSIRPFGRLHVFTNTTSPPIKPEVHNLSQRHHKKAEPRLQATCSRHFIKIERVVAEISSRTDRQTHKRTFISQYCASRCND